MTCWSVTKSDMLPSLLTKTGERAQGPHQYVNIIEDIRIEKLMKRKYAGLTKTFFKGYQKFQSDFLSEEEDVGEFTLADRINLYAKIGHFVEIEFTAEGQEILHCVNLVPLVMFSLLQRTAQVL